MADLLLQAGIAIAVLAIVGLIAHRFGQSVIPAYIVVGILVGPNAPVVQGVSFNLLDKYEFITLFAELGIVLLLFFIGLEFSVDRLLARRGEFTRAGTVDFVANAGVGLAIALAFGFDPLEAAFVAGIVYISSSAVITKSLIDRAAAPHTGDALERLGLAADSAAIRFDPSRSARALRAAIAGPRNGGLQSLAP